MRACKTDQCDNTLKESRKSDYCTNCRAGFLRWLKRRPSDVLERRRKLQVYSARTDLVIHDKGLTEKVVRLQPLKRRSHGRS